ncbi:hypothetical protein NP493_96g02033 [Ridgeia piscesae]|uniref:Secreted protein n=1 Tax=Ridgeia piscesae TaxID=27915 RepID=A0AAD9P869_RIDPI|nr:hypothetical protein NP493_96g02033 [Ridgeia piscesae]
MTRRFILKLNYLWISMITSAKSPRLVVFCTNIGQRIATTHKQDLIWYNSTTLLHYNFIFDNYAYMLLYQHVVARPSYTKCHAVETHSRHRQADLRAMYPVRVPV